MKPARWTGMGATLVMLLGGCGGAAERVVYPPAPPIMIMYDTEHLDDEASWTTTNAHDPSIVKADDGTYYVVSTDVKVGGAPQPGLMVRKSKDLIHWTWVGRALPGVPEAAAAWTGGPTLWAPDVRKFGSRYRLYYASSTFGSNTSYIGLATAASMEGPWRDEGEVIQTGPGDGPNAIDPQIAVDADGNPWFVYGSFFDGIHIARLDPDTGKLREPGFGKIIAARDPAKTAGAVEAPFIVYKPEFKKYYLFVSYDSLSSDYNVRVARADAIDGPYVDYNGRAMTDTAYDPPFEVGTKILGGYKFGETEGWIAPGHNSVLQDGDGDYLVHHARPEGDPNWMYFHVRKLLWTKDGWPVVSPERYAGERMQRIPKREIPGEWERLVQSRWIDGQAPSSPLRLLENGRIGTSDSRDRWSFDGDRTLTLTWAEAAGRTTTETVLLLPSWDWELNRPALVFTGLDGDGQAVWGKQTSRLAG